MTRVDVREFETLQAGVDEAVPLLIAAGQTVDYEDRYIGVQDGTDIQVDGELRKVGYPNAGGTVGSFIRNKDLTRKANGVRIHGRGVIRAVDHTKTGNLFALYGDKTRLDGFTVSCWAGGRAMVLSGDHIQARGLDIYGSPDAVGNGGVRVVGGNWFRGWGLIVKSGDDALQFVPSGSPTDPLFDQSIHGGRYIGCFGHSTVAKAMVVGLQNPQMDDVMTMTASVTDVGFRDCDNIGGVAALVVQNLNSTGVIDGVHVDGGSTDMGPSTAKVLGQEVLVKQAYGSGGVRNVYTNRHPIRNPRTRVSYVTSTAANVVLDGLT